MLTSDDIKAALGIDNSIDIATTDPIATMADGDKYEYLYEKGSQITALVFSMQSALNEINALQETSETYFLELAKTLEAQYAETSEVVDIETEVFIDAYVDAVLVAKETVIQDDRKTDIKNALHSLVPVISVRFKAAITTALSNFTTGQFITDFKAMAQGTASSTLAASYATDINALIAADQSIEPGDLVIKISLADDSATVDEDSSVVIAVLSNDTYMTPVYGFSIATSAPSNGQVLLNADNTLSYVPNTNFNGTDAFTYTVTVDDRSATANVSIIVNPINDAPVISGLSSSISVAENLAFVVTVSASDVEGDTLTYTLTGTDASSLSINSSSGVITFNSAPDYETKATYSVTLNVSDGTNTTSQAIIISVTDTDEVGNAPVITSFPTFSAAENQTAVGMVTATDADTSDTLTYTLTGTDASSLSINSSSGVITFNSAPDYETKATYSVTVHVSDGTNTTPQALSINVTDVNETSPVITSSPTFSAAENQLAVGTVTATDADTSDTLTYTLTGTDASSLSINSSSGVITFNSAPDYESKATYSVTVNVSDGTNTTPQALSINVTDVNETSPVITSSPTFSAAENQVAVDTVTATDADTSDTLTYTLTGTDASSLSINISSGVITFDSAPDYETKATYFVTVNVSDGTNTTPQALSISVTNVNESSVSTIADSASTNEESAVTLNPLTNDTIVTAGYPVSVSAGSPGNGSVVVNSGNTLTYTPSLNFFGTDSFTYTVTVESVSSSAEVTITVNGVNDLPIINSLSSTLTPDENQTVVVTVNASDIETSSLSYSISGTDRSLFGISNSGALTFNTAPDYESPSDADADNSYAITITVGDGTATTSQAVTVEVQNVADQVSGVAVDGYVAGATVFQDLDNDGVLDSGEPNTSTNSLGSFSLILSSVNKSAPVRIINGYDLATNEIHPSIMDISVTETGSYIITPISTLVGRLKIEDTTLSGTVPQSMISAALGITLTDSPNDSILGFDPIAYFNGSDSTLAAEARPVFAASQLLMAQGGGNYGVNKYITDQVLAALSTTLTSASGTSISMSSAADIIAIKQDAYDAIFNGIVDTTLADSPPINNVQFKNNKAVMTDYLNGSSSSQVQHSLYGVHDGTTTLVADLVGAKLDYENLKQIIDNDGTGTPLDLSFELSSLPVGSGSTSVTLRLFYGSDAVQDSNEDYLQVTLTANWESDGTTLQVQLPANSNLVATFFDRSGTTLSRTVTNIAEDVITATKDGPNRPTSLAIRLSTLFNAFPTEVSGLSSFLDGAATFTYQVEFGSFTIYDHLENPFTKIQGTFAVNSTPDIAVFADDIYVHENATTKDIIFRLSQASSSNVTVDYAISAASSASSSDYTLSAGTVTIPAGSTSTTLAVAVTNDTAVESQEEIRLSLSNAQNAVLGRTTVSAYITDGEKILDNSTQKAILVNNIFKDSKASINLISKKCTGFIKCHYFRNKLYLQSGTG